MAVLKRVLILLACLWLTHNTALQAAEGDAPKPNVVVFLVDDMGIMDTSLPFLTNAAGQPQRYPLNDFYRTPQMERLAARGVRFNQFCAMSVCSPTRVSILTGQNAARHRTTNWINPDRNNRGDCGPPDWNWEGPTGKDVTLARLLQSAGYRTIHVGKGHFGPRHAEGADPQNLGFDINVGGGSMGAPGSYYGQDNYGHGGRRASHAVPHLEKYHGTDTYLTEALTIEAKEHVTQAVQDRQPFFLYMSHYAVHAPLQSDPRFAANYTSSGMPAPAQTFATMVEGMDKSLGDLLDHLEGLNVAENTLVLFLGDNGTDAPLGHQHEVACAAPLRGRKGAHYEGGMRVPFIASWAKPSNAHPHQRQFPIRPNSIVSHLAAVYDLFPTILAVAGVKPPSGHVIDGQSLLRPMLDQPEGASGRGFLMHYPHAPHRSEYFTSYRDDGWKVIYHYFPSEASEGSHYQLYNLADDPFESKNLAASHPNELRQMMQQLVNSLEVHDAVLPLCDDSKMPLKPKLP